MHVMHMHALLMVPNQRMSAQIAALQSVVQTDNCGKAALPCQYTDKYPIEVVKVSSWLICLSSDGPFAQRVVTVKARVWKPYIVCQLCT